MTQVTKTEQLDMDRVKRLIGQTPLGIAATAINSIILVLVLWGLTPVSRLLFWLSAVLSISVIRLFFQVYFNRKVITADNTKRIRDLFLTALFFSGCIWGSSGIFLLPSSSIAHQVFIAFVLGGMVAGSVGVFSPVMASYYCFSIPALFPITVYFFQINTDIHYAMGTMVTLFWFIMLVTARRLNREMTESLNLKYENVDLISDLEKEIIERKRAEERLIWRNREIESIVEKRTEELRGANEILLNEVEEREEIVKALRESEEKYRELANSLPQIVFESDISGNITFINRNSSKVFGYSDKDLDKGLNLLEMLVPSERQRALEDFQKALSGERLDGNEYTAERKDGSTFPVVVHSDLIRINGKVAGTRGIIIDLTQQKLEEDNRKKLEAQLVRAQKMEALGTLAGGVAHDLNNMLSGIIGYPDLLLMQIPEDSPLRKPILAMQESGNKAAAIVQDLLTLTRRSIVVEAVVNLNDIISEYLESPEFKKLMSFHPFVELEVNLGRELPNIIGSPIHLTKTIMNLVSNALEAMKGGGNLVIVTENRYLDRPLRGYDKVNEGEYSVVKISDNGTGIPATDLERIFEPFFTKKVMGKSGTGLGMAVVWGTVKDHGGYIDVESVEGKGTTITLYFPVTGKKLEKPESQSELFLVVGKGESILVVDDVENQRNLAHAMLSQMGYSVSTVSSGEDAVEYMKNHRADLLVLDMIMDQGMDGLDTYKKILAIHPKQKAIIASGFSETLKVKEAQRLGAGPYIKKPYTLAKLGRIVRSELDRK